MSLNLIFWIIFFAIIVMAFITVSVQKAFQEKNKKYALKQSSSQKTGAEVARAILEKNGITNVKVIKGREGLDHFDPKSNLISLSPSIYDSSSVSAMAIAAHECGHALQWAKKSIMIRFRDTIAVPVQIATQVGQMMFSMSLFILLFSVGSAIEKWLLWTTVAGLFIYGAMGLFQLITLPVEFGASMKAKKELKELKFMVTENDIEGTKRVLNAAAMTYVVSFVTTILTLALFIVRLLLLTRRN